MTTETTTKKGILPNLLLFASATALAAHLILLWLYLITQKELVQNKTFDASLPLEVKISYDANHLLTYGMIAGFIALFIAFAYIAVTNTTIMTTVTFIVMIIGTLTVMLAAPGAGNLAPGVQQWAEERYGVELTEDQAKDLLIYTENSDEEVVFTEDGEISSKTDSSGKTILIETEDKAKELPVLSD